MIKPKFEDFDYGEGRKDLSWCQYAKALEEYVTFLEAQDPAFRQSLVVGRSEQCLHTERVWTIDPYDQKCFKCVKCGKYGV